MKTLSDNATAEPVSQADDCSSRHYTAAMHLKALTSFIHSGHFYSAFKSSTTRRRSWLQHGYCIRVSRWSAQATAGKGLAQGP